MEGKKYPPYLFDIDFDALSLPPEPEEVEEAPPPPTFSEDELQAARDTAFEAGRAEGLAQASSGLEQQLIETVAVLQNGFSALAEAQYAANHETMRETVQVAATIMARLLPAYARTHGLAEIEDFVKGTISSLFSEAEIVIHVPEALAEDLSNRLAPVASGTGGTVKIVPDPALGPSDCRMDWGDGGAERNGDRVIGDLEEIISRFIEHEEVPPMAIDLEREPTPVSPPAPPRRHRK